MIIVYRKIKKHRAQKAAEVAAAAAAAAAATANTTPSAGPSTNGALDAPPGQGPTTDTVTSAPTPASAPAPAPAPAPVPKKTCPQCKQEKSALRKYRWKLLFCLLPSFFVASLDLTIVATALPSIASHYNRFNQLNWIVTAFTLTSTAFIPFSGQISDIFGRHAGLQASVFILLIGSVLCAVAPNWPVLLLGRGLQGAGVAGVQNISLIVLADKVSLKEQAVNTSIFQLMSGVGYSVGPLIGGYLTNSNWRYCFVLAAGMSGLSLGTIFLLRKDLKPGMVSLSRPPDGRTRLQAFASGMATLDIGGTLLFIFGVGLIILGTAWGGSTFAWDSAAVIASLVIGVVLFILFVIYEALLAPPRALSRVFPRTKPMIPSSILHAKDVILVCLIAAATGAALYSVFYFIGIYFTLVEAYEASNAGIQLLYYVPGIGVGVYAAIFVCNVWPRQTFWPLFIGTIVETAGIAVLAYAVKARNATLVNVMMGIAGAGTGMRFMPSNLHLAGMFREKLAAVYSLLRFALPFGGTLALTVMGSVFQNEMSAWFGARSLNSASSVGSTSSINLHTDASLNDISQLPPAQQTAIRAQGATATMWAFISILPFLGVSLIASTVLGNVWISKAKSSEPAQAEVGEASREDGTCHRHATATGLDAEVNNLDHTNPVEFLSSIYLLALIRGNVRQLKQVQQVQRAGDTSTGLENSVSGAGSHLQRRLHDETVEKDASDPLDTRQSSTTHP